MPANRKFFVHGMLFEIGFRTQSGLPLPAGPLLKMLLEDIFARAQSNYAVTICHFVIMANHAHLLVVVESPEAVPKLVEYIKRESATAINHLLGRVGVSVWKRGYDSPIILDSDKAIQRIGAFWKHLSSCRGVLKSISLSFRRPFLGSTLVPAEATEKQNKKSND